MEKTMTGSERAASVRRNNIKDQIARFEAEMEANGYKYHHSASRKGYQSMSGTWHHKYAGKFGIGYVLELPNLYTPAGRYGYSNNYYRIRYYTK